MPTRYHSFVYNIGIQEIQIRIPHVYTNIVFVYHIGMGIYTHTNCFHVLFHFMQTYESIILFKTLRESQLTRRPHVSFLGNI